MSIAGSQQRTLLELFAHLRPHWRRDRNLPARIQALLARQRSFGARDRRLYRELIYTTLRYLPWVERELDRDSAQAVALVAWLAADSRATEYFRAAFLSDWPPCPPQVAARAAILAERGLAHGGPAEPTPSVTASSLLPEWFQEHCPAAFLPGQIDSLLARAPLWIRLQTAQVAAVSQEFGELGWRWEPSPVLPTAWRVFDQVDVTRTKAYEAGLIEIQDLASQFVLESSGIEPGGRWLDACAGAGGKTLQLAALLGAHGHIDATDIRPAALRELAVRATRAGMAVTDAPTPARTGDASRPSGHFATLRVVRNPAPLYDGVLVDAPCSGSGTWRRSPHLKWTTTPAQIDQASAKQREILAHFSRHVRSGGRLIYATCSLSRQENQEVVAAFLEATSDFSLDPPSRSFGGTSAGAGLTFLPSLHDTDGLFVATFRRRE